jgi:1,2-diacylglycerol 3-beta-glucosyltransferase
MPFEGLPLVWQILFTVALCIVAGMFLWTLVLFVRSGRDEHTEREPDPALTDAFMWVFLVPALNEAVTIRDSVDRLLAVNVSRRRILVIDDGSDDGTDEILADMSHPDLEVLRRDLPEARKGKAAGLNNAYRLLHDVLAGAPRDEVIVAIVDADGRLHPDAPSFAATHFADPEVGGLQSLVRIYNRGRLLTWMQDLEFAVYGHLYQAGRNDWGTAGMGGNGQFNRLSALDDVADEIGPWRDRLTEDQDLGLRLIAEGWEGRQDVRATVSQQGLSALRPLLRQRTRWSQGGLQALNLVGSVVNSPFPRVARFELLLYLLMPFWQGIIGVSLIASVYLAVTDVAPFWGDGPLWHLLFFYLLAFGGTMLACLAGRRGQGPRGWIAGLLLGHVYAVYTWIIWPVLLRATARQVFRRSDWAKTKREPLEDDSPLGVAPTAQ